MYSYKLIGVLKNPYTFYVQTTDLNSIYKQTLTGLKFHREI